VIDPDADANVDESEDEEELYPISSPDATDSEPEYSVSHISRRRVLGTRLSQRKRKQFVRFDPSDYQTPSSFKRRRTRKEIKDREEDKVTVEAVKRKEEEELKLKQLLAQQLKEKKKAEDSLEMSEYEKQRLKNIQRNQEFLAQLGLLDHKSLFLGGEGIYKMCK